MTWTPPHCDPTAPFGDRLVEVAVSALAAGRLGQTRRLDYYRNLIACGRAQDLSSVRTSCGIFVRACMHWAGRIAPAGGVPGWPLVGAPGASWLGLTLSEPAWVPRGNLVEPMPGAVFWKSSPDHVGIFLAPLGRDVWATAEGGGGDGTECAITWRHVGADFPHLQGVWMPDRMTGIAAPPGPSGEPPMAVPALPMVRGAASAAAVLAWQKRMLARDPKALPVYGPDSDWGKETAVATRVVQLLAGLPVNGDRVDLATWEACRK
jgi:hypothetical protein